jgi:hypothetical protein
MGTVPAVAILATWLGGVLVSFLQAAYAFGDGWRTAAVAMLSAVLLALLWNERRRFLAQLPLEPGLDEASWRAAEEDLAARDHLQDRPAVAIVALCIAVLPSAALWWWDRENVPLGALLTMLLVLAAASLVPSRRAEREGTVRLVEGSRRPAGWAALGAVAVGLPLAWLPLVLMAAAVAGPRALLLLAVPALHAAHWCWSSYAWRRPLRIDLRLREIPIDWQRRQRDARIARLPWLTFIMEYLLVMGAGLSVLGELIGPGWAFFLPPIWAAVMIGLFGTGWAFFTRTMRRSAAQGGASTSRYAASASASVACRS